MPQNLPERPSAHMREPSDKNIFQVFSIVWVVGIIMLLLFEKVKQIGRSYLPVTAPTQ